MTLNIDDFINVIRKICVNNTVEFTLTGKRDNEGGISITNFAVSPKSEEEQKIAGFK